MANVQKQQHLVNMLLYDIFDWKDENDKDSANKKNKRSRNPKKNVMNMALTPLHNKRCLEMH